MNVKKAIKHCYRYACHNLYFTYCFGSVAEVSGKSNIIHNKLLFNFSQEITS